MLRTGPTRNFWYLQIANDNDLVRYLTDIPIHSSTGDWAIDWSDDRVLVWYNNEVKVDTIFDIPYLSQGAGLNFPDVDLTAYAEKWGGDSLTISNLMWGLVPDEESVILPGDSDFDGDVDLADLARLAGHYGTTTDAAWPMGDFDSDFDVDLADLSLLASNYGTGAAQAMADFKTLSATPEPASLALLGIGTLMLMRRPRPETLIITLSDSAISRGQARASVLRNSAQCSLTKSAYWLLMHSM